MFSLMSVIVFRGEGEGRVYSVQVLLEGGGVQPVQVLSGQVLLGGEGKREG